MSSLVHDRSYETVKAHLIQSIAGRLEEEVVKELVNALYHYAMTRLNPDDVTVRFEIFLRRISRIYLNLVYSTH